MRRYIEAARGRKGLSRLFMLMMCGALTALALPPYHLIPLGMAGFSLYLVISVASAPSPTHAFKDGMCYGFGFFLAGLYWIAVALHVDIERFFWLVPFAVCGIPLVLSIYTGLTGYAAIKCPPGRGQVGARFVLFMVFWMLIAEGARAFSFTGFPWNMLGYSWVSTYSVLQAASLGGIWLLSLIACVLFAAPAFMYAAWTREGNRVFCVSMAVVGIVLPLAAYLYGEQRLANYTMQTHDDFKVRIVQPNIPQKQKWDADARRDHMNRLTGLSKNDDKNIRFIIWPEAAVPYMMTAESGAPYVAEAGAPDNGMIFTGIMRGELNGDTNRPRAMFNSFAAISRKGLEGYYDKSHLVPFGEYVPLRRLFPFVEKITHGMMDFSAGDGPVTMEVDGFPPFSPLICYEIIFPGQVIANAPAKRPEVIINVTNDAWYGDTGGPYQHFAMAAVRAAEEGMPVIRAANSGISGYIDPMGRPMGLLSLSTHGILDFYLPQALEEAPLFSRMMR